MEKDPCRGAVYLIVLCDHPYLVSVLFAVLLSLYLVTFKMFFITCNIIDLILPLVKVVFIVARQLSVNIQYQKE